MLKMALQDFCNFQENFEDTVTTERSSVPFGRKTSAIYVRDLDFRKNTNMFNFYIPVAEYLDESPIQFTQIGTVRSSKDVSSLNSCSTSHTLPIRLPFASSQSVPIPFPMSHGTTTLAFVFQGGVLAAADTRSSCSGLVACPASQKVLPIHSHLVGTTSGTSADCAIWKRILTRELRLYQLRHGKRLSTSGAAKVFSHMLHPFKGTELCVAAMLCGWDEGEGDDGCYDHRVTKTDDSGCSEINDQLNQKEFPGLSIEKVIMKKTSFSGPSLFYICSDGTRLKGTLFSVGSGSPYAYSILDQGVHWRLSVVQATSLAREAVYRATHRDAYSGNCVDIYQVNSKGWTCRSREDLKEEYYREKERQIHKGRERQDMTLSK